jgi:hypothetical protein
MSSDVDTAAVAALIAKRARCAMLDALFDGGERTAGSLARVPGSRRRPPQAICGCSLTAA